MTVVSYDGTRSTTLLFAPSSYRNKYSVWQVEVRSVEVTCEVRGRGLEPYYTIMYVPSLVNRSQRGRAFESLRVEMLGVQ
jgi:uncharacterized Zn finger protein